MGRSAWRGARVSCRACRRCVERWACGASDLRLCSVWGSAQALALQFTNVFAKQTHRQVERLTGVRAMQEVKASRSTGG